MGILWSITIGWCVLIFTPIVGQAMLYLMAVSSALFLMPFNELVRGQPLWVSQAFLFGTPILIVTAVSMLAVHAQSPPDQRRRRFLQVAAMAVLVLAATLTAGALNSRMGQVQ